MKNSRVLLFLALVIFIALGISIKVYVDERNQSSQQAARNSNPETPPAPPPYEVLGTVPKSMEMGFARDQTILIYLDRPLAADQKLSSPFTGVVYRKAGDPADGTPATGTATILPSRKGIAFVPSPPLKEGRFDTANYNYELDVSYATTGLHVVPYTISFSTVALFDTAGFWVQQASPEDDAISVSPTYHPFLIMDEPLDPATVQDSNVQLKDAAGNVVATTISFDYTNNALMIVPSATLQPSTVYIISAGLGFKTMAGQTLLCPYTWQFTTRAASTPPDLTSPKPYIVRVDPEAYGKAIPVDAPITVFFSASMDPCTLTSQTVHLRAYGQSTDLPVALTYSTTGKSLTIQPTRALPGSTAISLDLDAENILGAADNTASLQPLVNTPTPLFTLPRVATDAQTPSPTPSQNPSVISPQLQDYLTAHDRLMSDEAAFMKQHQADDPATRQAALQQWRQENAARFQQLQIQSQALAQKASASTAIPPQLPANSPSNPSDPVAK